MKPKRWVERQIKEKPFFSVLIVILIIVVPGYFRIENAADEAKETAHALAVATEEDKLETCQTRNTFQKNTREKFTKYNNTIELALTQDPSDPERVARTKVFMDSLRSAVETTPQDEDQDCNEDGYFDELDYLP